MNNLPEDFIVLLKNKGYSQKSFSTKIGLSDDSMTRYRQGLTSPTLIIANKMAKELDISLDDLAKYFIKEK